MLSITNELQFVILTFCTLRCLIQSDDIKSYNRKFLLMESDLLIYVCYFVCIILGSLLCMSVFLVWSLSLDYSLLISARILVFLITLLLFCPTAHALNFTTQMAKLKSFKSLKIYESSKMLRIFIFVIKLFRGSI